MPRLLPLLCCLLVSIGASARDLPEIRADGVLRHLGIPYANFVTGAGGGLDLEVIEGFAQFLGLEYAFVPSTWATVFGDLTGRNAARSDDGVAWLGEAQVRGDLIASGMTMLDWRRQVVDFGIPTFPTGVWLVARADSTMSPIRPTGRLQSDIQQVRTLLPGRTLLAVPNTCLDPQLYRMSATGADIRLQPPERKLNELVPAILNADAEATMLDVPDALIALERWPGRIKVIGPISGRQFMAPAFPKDAPRLREAFNAYFADLKLSGRYREMVREYYPAVFRYYGDFFE
ncbi:transporter substrate-binding domain-containing protein [Thiorhodococcus minor]|uniref:Transporter substrate-binding domain-containing protein n=1 Tax=Thiorhodococcus minor TaxID=57489 RepID=A0A6M0K5T8_9GAMM|nr:transporter substrate-binding domain-containing protein [Thiorhodococcus minor]NEV64671.1 transporter substrate-binding domain-containing protein [Thiorhodococcus minor]